MNRLVLLGAALLAGAVPGLSAPASAAEQPTPTQPEAPAPDASVRDGDARVRPVWNAQLQRWVIACPSGTVPRQDAAAPDDFHGLSACAPAQADTSPAGTPHAVALWSPEKGRWLIACPDRMPVSGQDRDPDDFTALLRCR